MRHLFVTQDYPPLGGGMARRHVELCRRLVSDGVAVSTVAAAVTAAGAAFDAGEPYAIARQPFGVRGAKTVTNAARWARWLVGYAEPHGVGVLHCGNVRPVGYAAWWAARRTRLPYVVYVYGGDLLRERAKARRSSLKRWSARRIFGDSAGVIAISDWSAALAASVMREVGVDRPPPVAAIPLGTDPRWFRPDRDGRALRQRWGVGDAPLLLTVARLVPHKGQDIALQALARLAAEMPALRYAIVGSGPDALRLRSLAAAAGVADRVVWAGSLTDDEIADAYATATLYVGLSRIDRAIDAEGFGIAFVEAAASGLPSVAGDAGGVPSAVRNGETGLLVPPGDVDAVVAACRGLLTDPARRVRMGHAARAAVTSYWNWDRVARETRAFVARVASGERVEQVDGLEGVEEGGGGAGVKT